MQRPVTSTRVATKGAELAAGSKPRRRRMKGSMLPFLLRRLGFDPAASSAPFVATLVDVTGLCIYFSVALLMLRGTLL